MAQSIIEVIFKGKDQLSGSLKKIKGGLKDVIGGVTGLNPALFTLAGAVAGVSAAAVKGTKELIDYNKSMKDSADATGATVEEFSRIVQAADDVGISMGAVETALKMATKNGFAPSIDSLARLADTANAMNTPTERAAYLAKIFGRNWAELNPLLARGGQAIRDMTAAQADGLVVTDKEVEQTEQLRQNIDKMTDSWIALRNTALLPVVQEINTEVDALQRLNQRLIDTGEYGRIGLLEYAKQWRGMINQDLANQERYRIAGIKDELGLLGGAAGNAVSVILNEFAKIPKTITTEHITYHYDIYEKPRVQLTIEHGQKHVGVGHAAGGFLGKAQGGLMGTIVGERGPELITPGGWVKTAGQTENALGMKEMVSEMRAIRDEFRWLARNLPTTIRDSVIAQ